MSSPAPTPDAGNDEVLSGVRRCLVACCRSARNAADVEAVANLLTAYTAAFEAMGVD